MAKTVSAAEANRDFSRLMRLASSGEEVIVTSRGQPRIKLVRIEPGDDEAIKRGEAFDELTQWLQQRPALDLPLATRNDMYD